MKPENRIVTNILSALRKRGIYARRIHGSMFQVPGFPDILCCINGLFVTFEVKTEAGRLSKIQEHEIAKIRQAGGMAGVVRSVSETVAIVDELIGVRT